MIIKQQNSFVFRIKTNQYAVSSSFMNKMFLKPFNTLRTGDVDLRFYITTVQDE